jgi:hypothetical protein
MTAKNEVREETAGKVKQSLGQHIKKRNARCPHNAKFPLVEIDVAVNQI